MSSISGCPIPQKVDTLSVLSDRAFRVIIFLRPDGRELAFCNLIFRRRYCGSLGMVVQYHCIRIFPRRDHVPTATGCLLFTPFFSYFLLRPPHRQFSRLADGGIGCRPVLPRMVGNSRRRWARSGIAVERLKIRLDQIVNFAPAPALTTHLQLLNPS